MTYNRFKSTNQGVVGSSPAGRAKDTEGLRETWALFHWDRTPRSVRKQTDCESTDPCSSDSDSRTTGTIAP
jgi:hypothetical protein